MADRSFEYDPHNTGSRTIYTPALSHELAGKFEGNQATVGILISKESPFTVVHVYDLIDADGNIQGQPGYLNEVVYAGDKLLYVDSVPTTGLSFYSVRAALDGPLGSHVTLTLERSNDGKLYEVRVRRHDPGQFIEGAPKTDLLETVHHPEMAKAASQASGLLDAVKSRLSGQGQLDVSRQSMESRQPAATSTLVAEKEHVEMMRKVEDLQNMFDGLSQGIQRWEEVVDPQTNNVYYKDMLTGKVSGKFLNVVPGADSYGFAGIGISLFRKRGRRTDDGPIYVNKISEKSSIYGKVERNDRLLAVNGESVDDVGVKLVYALLNGRDGTAVRLRLSRDHYRDGPQIFNVEANRKNGIPLAEDLDKESNLLSDLAFNSQPRNDGAAVSTPATWIRESMASTPGFSLGLESSQLEFFNMFQSKPSNAATAPREPAARDVSVPEARPRDDVKLEVSVDAARNLPVVGTFGLCDIYAEVAYGSEQLRTPVVSRTEQGVNSSVNPDFHSKFKFERTANNRDLVVSVYGREGLATIFIGQVVFPKATQFLQNRGDQDGWYRIVDKSDGHVAGFRGEEPHLKVQCRLLFPDAAPANLSSSAIDPSGLPASIDDLAHIQAEQQRRRLAEQSLEQYTPKPTLLANVPAMPGDDLLPSLITFMESSAEGQEAMHARLQAITANANRNSAGDLHVIAIATRAFDAALKLKRDRVDVEKPFNMARTDIQHLNEKLKKYMDALDEKDIELASIRAREGGTARVIEESRSDVQRLGGMLKREGTMRLSAEEHGAELARQVQDLQVSVQELRRDLAREKAENSLNTARIAEKDKAFARVMAEWEEHTTRSGTLRTFATGSSSRPQGLEIHADFELHGAVCADFHVLTNKVEALDRELTQAEDEVAEFNSTLTVSRKHLDDAKRSEDAMQEAMEAEGPALEALRSYIEVLRRNSEAYGVRRQSSELGKGGESQYTTMLEKEVVQLQDQVERMGKDLLLSAQVLQGAMDNHQLAESMLHFSQTRLTQLARVRQSLERDLQERHMQVEASVRGIKRSTEAVQRAAQEHRDHLVRTLRGQCDRISESFQKFYSLDPPPGEEVPVQPSVSHTISDRATHQRKGGV